MVGVQQADVAESTSKGGEVHVYAHPRKVVTNLQRPNEKDKVHATYSIISKLIMSVLSLGCHNGRVS